MPATLYFLQAIGIGLAVAAPVGPIGLLCIRKTLEIGLIGALSVGLGAALADSVYGFIAGSGLTIISTVLLNKIQEIKIIGSIFLCYLAYKEIREKPNNKEINQPLKNIFSIITSTFLLTITNPMTILIFLGIFSSIAGETIHFSDALWMVLGIFTGSMLWWLILGSIVLKIKHYLSPKWTQGIKFLSAGILLGFASWSIISIF